MGGNISPAAPQAGSLGITAKYVDARAQRFRLQRAAAKLLKHERVANCLWSVASDASGVSVRKMADKPSHFTGLQTCGSVWHCPVCSSRVSNARKDELDELLKWSRAEGHVAYLITLTARHGRSDRLADLVDLMKRAKRRVWQSRCWRRLRVVVVGTVTATEVTFGRAHGWHPHFHVLVVAKSGVRAFEQLSELEDEWLRCLGAVGLSGNGNAFDLQCGNHAGRYVAKFGPAEEIALGAAKKGRGSNSTPFQLLERAHSDRLACSKFLEYSRVFKGRRQLVWSNGLKAAVGVSAVSDEQAAVYPEDGQKLAFFSTAHWRAMMKSGVSRSAILGAADMGGSAAIASLLSPFLSKYRAPNGSAGSDRFKPQFGGQTWSEEPKGGAHVYDDWCVGG